MSRKTRRDRLPTSILPVSVEIPGSAKPRTVDGGALLQNTLEEMAGEIGIADTRRSAGRRSRTRDLRYETDGGVSLAGGRLDEDEDDDEDVTMSSSGQTVSTLPPPYSTLGQT